jgi:hypothetical protein
LRAIGSRRLDEAKVFSIIAFFCVPSGSVATVLDAWITEHRTIRDMGRQPTNSVILDVIAWKRLEQSICNYFNQIATNWPQYSILFGEPIQAARRPMLLRVEAA